MGLLRAADDRPVVALVVTTVVLYGGLRVWAAFADAPILLARSKPDARVMLYGQFASSAVALLAVSLTVLAILIALPDRQAVAELRAGPAWPRLQGFLLAAALLCLVTLVCAHVGAGVDTRARGREWLELLLTATAAMSIISVLAGGLAFGLFLRRAADPPDPSQGRGLGGT